MIDYLEHLGCTINGAYYAELRRLCQEIARKRRGKLSHCVLLLQDKTPAHTSKVAMSAATECGFEILSHPPYSPDLAPSDFYQGTRKRPILKGLESSNRWAKDKDKKALFNIAYLKQTT